TTPATNGARNALRTGRKRLFRQSPPMGQRTRRPQVPRRRRSPSNPRLAHQTIPSRQTKILTTDWSLQRPVRTHTKLPPPIRSTFMPVTNTDAVLWYNVGDFGKAG